jgi:peroxiredoxin
MLLTPSATEVRINSVLRVEQRDYPIGLKGKPIGLCENDKLIETTKVSPSLATLLMKWRSLEQTAPGTDLRPLREIFAERKERIAQYVPAQTQAVHEQAVAELKARAIAASALAVGAKAAPFEVQDHDGKLVRSSDLLDRGRLVICFIRGRWCPFCVGQMEAMNLILPKIEQVGASLVAISPQTVKQSFFMHDQHKLRFPLLSDERNKVGSCTESRRSRNRCFAGRSAICRLRMAMTAGNCRSQRHSFWTPAERFDPCRRMRITGNGPNPPILWRPFDLRGSRVILRAVFLWPGICAVVQGRKGIDSSTTNRRHGDGKPK